MLQEEGTYVTHDDEVKKESWWVAGQVIESWTAADSNQQHHRHPGDKTKYRHLKNCKLITDTLELISSFKKVLIFYIHMLT